MAPLRQLIQKGATHIKVVLTQPQDIPHKDVSESGHIMTFTSRVIDIMLREILENDLKTLEKVNHAVGRFPEANEGKRIIDVEVVRPASHFPHEISAFKAQDIRNMIADGAEAARQRSVLSAPIT